MKRLGANLLILLLIYFNTATLLIVCKVRLPRATTLSSRWTTGPLPNHWVTERLFRMWDLFDRWSWSNWGFGAYGSKTHLDTPAKKPSADMVDLDIYQFFPQGLGESNRRIYLLSYRNNPHRLEVEYKRMAEVIQRLYNERNPGAGIEQVFVYKYTWKKSKYGYKHLFKDRTIQLLGHN